MRRLSVSDMTRTTSTSVRLAPPPPALMRVVNPLVRRMLRSRRLGPRFARQGLLEYTGRRTGRTRCVPVCLHQIGADTVVFTGRPWRWNFAPAAPVTVTQHGRTRTGRAVLLDADPRQIGRAMRAALDHGATPFDLGLKVAAGYQPTAEDLATIARSMIRIDFDAVNV